MQATASTLERGRDTLRTLFFLGDNFYPNGLNQDEDVRTELITQVLGPHRPLMERLGSEHVLAIAGNHDYYCSMLGPLPYGSCLAGNGREAEIPYWSYHFAWPASVRYPVAPGSADSVELLIFDSALPLTREYEDMGPYLDSLERLFRASVNRPGVTWRLFFAHHSPYSVGEHAGYRIWDGTLLSVGYRGNCIEEGDDPFKYAERLADYHEDICAPLYTAYKDSLFAVIERTGIVIQAAFAGHDHSLQLLYNRDRGKPPYVYVVSGAGSKTGKVRSPLPGSIYTHPLNTPEHKGESAYGFAVCRVSEDRLRIHFVNGETGEILEMGGATEFVVDRSGSLVETR